MRKIVSPRAGRGLKSDSVLDAYRNLSDAEWLQRHGLFVAEGRLVVRRVIEDPQWRLHSILVNEAARSDLDEVLDRVSRDVPIEVRPTADFRGITGFHLHRGCVALVHRPPPRTVDAVVDTGNTVVALEGVTNPDNVGGVFRNAAAFGAAGVLLSGTCCDPLYRKAVRTSMGAVLRIPFAGLPPLDELRTRGFIVVALTPREPSQTLETFAQRARGAKVVLAIGAEGGGLSTALETAADVRVRIPMAGGMDSLNVSVAAGIALYALKS